MRILIVSTVYNSTPPIGYGGIQRVVHYLTEALVELGHDVVLMAPPRSHCSGRTIHIDAYDPDKPWGAVKGEDDLVSEEPLYEAMCKFLEKEQVDVIHDWSFQNLFVRRHPDQVPFIISTCIPPAVNYSRQNCVASCGAHARLIGENTKHVYYGLPLKDWPYQTNKTTPAIHIAKIARFKAQHLAIIAAIKTGTPLVIAGNIENKMYFNLAIKPFAMFASNIQYIGEIDGTQKHLLETKALVQTPRWFDCFPLVILEALASATPVIALSAGGVPEQIKHGKTGYLCDNVSDLADAFRQLEDIDPAACRADAEARFSNTVMAKSYTDLYQQVIEGETW